MKRHLPLIATLTGLISFVGIIYLMLHPDSPAILVFLIYVLAACAGLSGLYLMKRKR